MELHTTEPPKVDGCAPPLIMGKSFVLRAVHTNNKTDVYAQGRLVLNYNDSHFSLSLSLSHTQKKTFPMNRSDGEGVTVTFNNGLLDRRNTIPHAFPGNLA